MISTVTEGTCWSHMEIVIFLFFFLPNELFWPLWNIQRVRFRKVLKVAAILKLTAVIVTISLVYRCFCRIFFKIYIYIYVSLQMLQQLRMFLTKKKIMHKVLLETHTDWPDFLTECQYHTETEWAFYFSDRLDSSEHCQSVGLVRLSKLSFLRWGTKIQLSHQHPEILLKVAVIHRFCGNLCDSNILTSANFTLFPQFVIMFARFQCH